jgi:hypothetical protein
MKKEKTTRKNSRTRRSFYTFLIIVLFWATGGSKAFADGIININNPGVSAGDGWTYANFIITITTNGTYTINGAGTYTINHIVVKTGVEANITLNNVDIDVNIYSDFCAFNIESGATVNLTLQGANILKSGYKEAGLQVAAGAVLNITEKSEGASLETAGGGYGAGIGGNGDPFGSGVTAGTITISGGNITAIGDYGGAGIGGGSGNAGNGGGGGTITISGGTVIATGGINTGGGGAGIGGGGASGGAKGGAGGTITITGGNVTATGNANGTGIGGGGGGSGVGGVGGTITITGGAVTATGSYSGSYASAGIGGAQKASAGNITLSGGYIEASGAGSAESAPGIGSNGAGGTINITDGKVIATGSGGAAGIGINSGNIEISGGTITATGGANGAGIGSNSGGTAGTIKISGGVVTATGGDGAGIGGGSNASGGKITITGGTITASSAGAGAAGIGGGNGQAGNGTVVITGGSVIAKGNAAGPQPANDQGASVYLNILTIGESPAVGDSLSVAAGSISGVVCTDGNPDPSKGVYGINDVITLGGGKVYFYLPASGGNYQTTLLMVEGKGYLRSYVRDNNEANNTRTLILPDLVITGSAASGDEIHGGTVLSENHIAEWIGNNTLTIKQNGSYTIAMRENVSATTVASIKVNANLTDVNVVLANVDIDISSIDNACAFGIETSTTVNLTLQGANTLKSGNNRAGLQVPYNAVMEITEASRGSSLTVVGGIGAAGIGGGNYNDAGSYYATAGNIKISGGTITANGGSNAAGIGSGNSAIGGMITITGGIITTTGGNEGAGIGGGYNSTTGIVIISGGTITAIGGTHAPGIGGGSRKDDIGTLMITGGNVYTKGTYGPQPTNGIDNIHLNVLTIGNPAVADSLSVTEGNIDGVACIDGVPIQGSGVYGIHDMITLNNGKVYFYLPETNGDRRTISLTVEDKRYLRSYIRDYEEANNTRTLIHPDLLITGSTASGEEIHGGTVLSENHIAEWFNDTLFVKQNGDYTFTMCEGVSTAFIGSVIVRAGVEANVIFDNISIDLEAIPNACAFGIEPNAKVALTLQGTNILQSGSDKAGLQVPAGAVLEITEASDGFSLNATGGSSGAGIGSSDYIDAGEIKIFGGYITAINGSGSAGVGGGAYGAGGTVTISNAYVEAVGGYGAAGIGGGTGAPGHKVTISSGVVIALSINNGAGIGGGIAFEGGEITITGGTIIASSTEGGAGIGGGAYGDGGIITISGDATVTADAGAFGAGIGGGKSGAGGTITITGGTITANAGLGGAGIGGGSSSGGLLTGVGGNITISGGTITATGGYDSGIIIGAGIGGGDRCDGGKVTISGGTVTAISDTGAGVGGGYKKADSGEVTITGGNILMVSNAAGPQPTNGNNDNVYLNVLTIGSPAIGDSLSVTAGSIDGINCINASPDPIEVAAGKYGIHDVTTLNKGKVYFYLPATSDEEAVFLTVDDTEYANGFKRPEEDNAQTLFAGPPTTAGVMPNGINVPLNGNVVITFNRDMRADLTEAAVKLNDVVLNINDASWLDEYTVKIPYAALDYGTTYIIHFSGFKDKAGRTISMVTSDTYSFVTTHFYEASGGSPLIDLGVKEFGYSPVEPQAFVVKSTGTGTLTNLKAQLTGDDADKFVITANLVDTLAVGDEATISIRPVDSLHYRKMYYEATLQVTGNNDVTLSTPVRFKVNKAAPKLEYLDCRFPMDSYYNGTENIIIYDGLTHRVTVTPKPEYAPHLGVATVRYNGSVEYPYAPGVYIVSVSLTEGANYTAGVFDVDLLVIYDPSNPQVPRWVKIEPTSYFDVNPAPDSFYVESGSNLILTLTPLPSLPEGYTPRVTTNRVIYADKYPSGIKIKANDDGTYSVQIAYIIEETVITIGAVSPSSGDDPTANNPFAIDAASDNPQVWSYNGHLYIRSAMPGRAAVYNLNGQQVKALSFAAGETLSQSLPAGVYVVQIGERSYKVLLH